MTLISRLGACALLAMCSVFAPALAGTTLTVRFTTGADNLRGGNVDNTGNNVSFHFVDERGAKIHVTRNANRSATWGNGSVNEVVLRDVGAVGALVGFHAEVSTRMKADIFEENDGWNLEALRITVNVDGVQRVLYEGMGRPLHRFVGGDAGRTFPLRRIVDECAVDADCDRHPPCSGVERCTVPRAAAANVLRQCTIGAPVACAAGLACNIDNGVCEPPLLVPVDADGDGFDSVATGGNDCDDKDGIRYPGNIEICDVEGHDEDCDPATGGHRDMDRDGYQDAACFNWWPAGTPTN